MEDWLAEAWGQAGSIESKPEWTPVEPVGWLEKRGRIYIFYRDAEGGWWYKTAFRGPEERIQTEYERIFGDGRRKPENGR